MRDLASTPLLALRTARSESLHDLLFAPMTLGEATWVAGECVYDAARTPDPFRYPDARRPAPADGPGDPG